MTRPTRRPAARDDRWPAILFAVVLLVVAIVGGLAGELPDELPPIYAVGGEP